MAIGYGVACPKPSRVDGLAAVQDRKRDQHRQAQAFRDQVWKRAGNRCDLCERRVRRTLDAVPDQGHVHHKRGRNVAPEDRYNAEAALLLCAICHANIHAGKVTR